MVNKIKVLFLSFVFIWTGCSNFNTRPNISNNEKEALPILSPMVNREYTRIANFELTNQYGKIISQDNVKGKVYVAEFFFSNCPSICPLVSKQLKRVFKKFENESDFIILSHTIDPKNDTVSKLLDYYTNILEIENISNWQLLTGDQNEIYNLANHNYGAVVYEDTSKLKDNIMHSGALLLIDKNGLIRGMYDGKNAESTNRLIIDVEKLLKKENSITKI